MKTSSYYFMYLFKVMAFIIFMIWLCSACNNRPEQIKMIHDYRDSIGITKLKLDYIDQQRDSLAIAYQQQYPARAFLRADTGARNAYARAESMRYHQLLKDQAAFDRRFDPIKFQLLEDLNKYQLIVDSLKLILQ